jgi:glycine dehydrogenase
MIEPTESESKAELDRFCEAMISIRNEVDEIAIGDVKKEYNILKNAPHTMALLMNENWDYSYTKEKAAFPLPWVKANKFWPSVRRVDDAFGDRDLICSCTSIKEYI